MIRYTTLNGEQKRLTLSDVPGSAHKYLKRQGKNEHGEWADEWTKEVRQGWEGAQE